MRKFRNLKTVTMLLLLLSIFSGLQAQNQILGRVVDTANKPLLGVTITNLGTKAATSTGDNGNFAITAKTGDILLATIVGYTAQRVPVRNNERIEIILLPVQGSLDEVVVQAYGTTTKRKTTSAISSLDISKVAAIPVASINDGVAGRLAGIIVVASSGAPGVKSTISIRGGGTPLFVIDDIIRSLNDFSNLNPSDIESYSILKDAAATALYGVSGANGVVLVTTKKGKDGKVSVNYSFNQINAQPTIFPTKLSSYENLKARNSVLISEGLAPLFSDADMEKFRTGSDPYKFPNTDWRKITMKNWAPETRHDLNISAGNRLLSYYAGISYYDQGSILKTIHNFNKRFTYRANTTSNFDKLNLKVVTSIDGFQENNEQPVDGYGGIIPNIQGNFAHLLAYNQFGLPSSRTVDNPVAKLADGSGYFRQWARIVNANLLIEYKAHFLKGLSFRGVANMNSYNNRSKSWTYKVPSYNDSSTTPIPANPPSLSINHGEGKTLTLQGWVLYNHKFGDHGVEFTGVYEQQRLTSSFAAGSRTNYQLIFDQFVAGPTQNQGVDAGEGESARASWLGRLNYNYKSKYYLEGSLRYDGSDLFPPGKQWGLFYAGSAGWIISEEKFMAPIIARNILDLAKLRVSYGQVGSTDNISRFQYVPGYGISAISWVLDGGPVQGTFEQGTLPSTSFSWQTTKSWDFGLDLATLNNRLSAGFDYFYTKTVGFIRSDTRFAQTLGVGLPPINSNEERRKEGFDFNVNWNDRIGKDFTYKLGVNFTRFNTLIINANEDEATLKNPYLRTSNSTGASLQTGYTNLGFYQTNNELLNGPRRISSIKALAGDLKYFDANGDGQIDGNDFRRIGNNTFPRSNYGFTIDLGYKGFFLNAVLQGSGKRDRYLGDVVQGRAASNQLVYGYQLNYWKPGQDNADVLFPRAVSTPGVNGNNNFVSSDFWLLKSGYMRLKYFQFGYDFSNKLLKRTPIKSMKVFVSGANLFARAKSLKFFIDPESDTNNSGYPIQRTVSFGANIGF